MLWQGRIYLNLPVKVTIDKPEQPGIMIQDFTWRSLTWELTWLVIDLRHTKIITFIFYIILFGHLDSGISDTVHMIDHRYHTHWYAVHYILQFTALFADWFTAVTWCVTMTAVMLSTPLPPIFSLKNLNPNGMHFHILSDGQQPSTFLQHLCKDVIFAVALFII